MTQLLALRDEQRLLDNFGRVARDLRVSLTDRCNLRCTYCMPAEGMQWQAPDTLLTDDELVRLTRIAVQLCGIERVRLTGGEPLIRRSVANVVAGIAALTSRPEISITTNGLLIDKFLPELIEAGLDRVNVSLDTLRPDRFKLLSRRDGLDRVLAGLAACCAAGLTPVKVNSVLIRGVNDDEACDLLSFCLDHDYELRFIEQMPLDADHRWRREEMVTADEILAALRSGFDLTEAGDRGSSPAEHFVVNGGPARVGVIASVTRPFCGSCDRTRLTADGQIRSCLFSTKETDLRWLLRGDATDETIADAWRFTMSRKAAGHGVGDVDFVQPQRSMSAIGG